MWAVEEEDIGIVYLGGGEWLSGGRVQLFFWL